MSNPGSTPAAAGNRPGPRLRLAFKILVSLGFLFALWHWIDVADLRARLRNLSYPPLFAAMILNLALLILNAGKLHMLFPPPRPSFPGIIRVNMITVFLSSFIPGGAGGELARWGYLSRACGSRNRALAGVLLDRITGLWAQILLALISWIAISRGTMGWRIAVPVAFAIIAAGVWGSLWGYKWFIRIMRAAGAWYERRTAGKGGVVEAPEGDEHLDQALADLLTRKSRFLRVAALSVGNHLLVAGTFMLVDRSIGGTLSLAHALIFLFWYTVILVLPVTVGNWGLSEGTLGVLYHYAGSKSATGVLMSLLLRVMNVPAIALGLFFFLREDKGNAKDT